jgi:hypothetical protein
MHLVDRLQARFECFILVRGARGLPEGAVVDEEAEVSHLLLLELELVPPRLERCNDQLEGLAVRIRMLLGAPKVAERDDGQRAVYARGRLGDGAQLGHGDRRLGRQWVAALGQPAASLFHDPRRSENERRVAGARLESEEQLLWVRVLLAHRRTLLVREGLDTPHLRLDGRTAGCLRVLLPCDLTVDRSRVKRRLVKLVASQLNGRLLADLHGASCAHRCKEDVGETEKRRGASHTGLLLCYGKSFSTRQMGPATRQAPPDAGLRCPPAPPLAPKYNRHFRLGLLLRPARV